MILDLLWSLLLQLIPLLFFAYLYIRNKYSFWSRRGVPGPRPLFPLGYQWQKAVADPLAIECNWARQFGPLYGVYTGLIPTLTTTDAALIKQVLVKDFHLFTDRRVLNSSHAIWNQNLFNVDARNWKRIRSIASPTFSSGKLRAMLPLMNRCVAKLLGHLDQAVPADGTAELAIKELVTGFTIDVIGSTSFGIETSANGATAAENAFLAHGLRFFHFNPARLAAVYALPRWLLKFLGIRTIFADEALDFFVGLGKSVIQRRRAAQATEQGGPRRSDLLQLLMDSYVTEGELKRLATSCDRLAVDMDGEEPQPSPVPTAPNAKKYTLSESEIIAQVMIFMVAGFETTAATLSHCVFQLIRHPAIQERLHAEISAILADCEPDSAEYCERILNAAPYLEAVIKETLRMFPPVIRIERRLAVDDYKLGGVPLEKDVLVEIPTVAVHYDPQYWPAPESFKPERFLPESKANIVPYTYLPFGAGPRNCLGTRFAYQEIKLCLAQLVARYAFSAAEGTPDRLHFLAGSIMLNSAAFPVSVSRRH